MVEKMNNKNPFYEQSRILNPDSVQVIFDVGANIGQTSEKYKKYFSEAKLHCFEPSKETFSKLRDKFENTDSVITNMQGIANENCKSILSINRKSGTNSLFPTVDGVEIYLDSNLIEKIGEESVEVTTLDDYCLENNIDMIDILKMDIQGSELLALQGASKILKEQRIKIIFCEIWFIEFYKGAPFFYEIYAFLQKNNFRMNDFYNLVYDKNGMLKWGDAIFINEEAIFKKSIKNER